ncbi:B3 domain-containing protein REM23-like isoform X1 [Papaver somniferum]|uniref:B3 domain-containing protein REM23-like isoform X1 n=1 Tax=Papaver somniferum TaxID=3469 RepID=UPI000E6F71AB|nr:B3 domain-containing protein REM23-like isoform X1 [Papaver somniferum]
MRKFVDPDGKHHFFKVLLEDDLTRMRIPEAFYPRISKASQSCERAVLWGPSGTHWVAKVKKSQDVIYLEKGWEVFVQVNGIQKYDFLVFRYEGSMQFSIKVFNMHGVPREECLAPVRSSPLVEEKIKHGRSFDCPPSGRPSTSLRSRKRRCVELQERVQQDRDESDEDESDEKDKSDEDEWDEDESDEDESDEDESDEGESDEDGLDEEDEDCVARTNGRKRGLSSRSHSAFFRIPMRAAYLKHNYVPIPWGIRREYFLDDVKKVIIIPSDASSYDREWRIRILHTKTDMRLSKGVTDFTKKKNGFNLKAGDVCHFEVVEKRSYKLVLRVWKSCT